MGKFPHFYDKMRPECKDRREIEECLDHNSYAVMKCEGESNFKKYNRTISLDIFIIQRHDFILISANAFIKRWTTLRNRYYRPRKKEQKYRKIKTDFGPIREGPVLQQLSFLNPYTRFGARLRPVLQNYQHLLKQKSFELVPPLLQSSGPSYRASVSIFKVQFYNVHSISRKPTKMRLLQSRRITRFLVFFYFFYRPILLQTRMNSFRYTYT